MLTNILRWSTKDPFAYILHISCGPLLIFLHTGLLALLSALPANGLRLGERPSFLEWVIFIWIISLLVAEISQVSKVRCYLCRDVASGGCRGYRTLPSLR